MIGEISRDLRNAISDFDVEVDSVAAELVRDGIASPWNAIVHAKKTVKQRRRARRRIDDDGKRTSDEAAWRAMHL